MGKRAKAGDGGEVMGMQAWEPEGKVAETLVFILTISWAGGGGTWPRSRETLLCQSVPAEAGVSEHLLCAGPLWPELI